MVAQEIASKAYPNLKFTQHALIQMEKRKISKEEVIEVLDNPDSVVGDIGTATFWKFVSSFAQSKRTIRINLRLVDDAVITASIVGA